MQKKYWVYGIAGWVLLSVVGVVLDRNNPPINNPAPTNQQAQKTAPEPKPEPTLQDCGNDLQCAFDYADQGYNLTGDCARAIEDLAIYDYKWEGWTSPRWKYMDREGDILSISGDAIRMANAFNAFSQQAYTCKWDLIGERVIEAYVLK